MDLLEPLAEGFDGRIVLDIGMGDTLAEPYFEAILNLAAEIFDQVLQIFREMPLVLDFGNDRFDLALDRFAAEIGFENLLLQPAYMEFFAQGREFATKYEPVQRIGNHDP